MGIELVNSNSASSSTFRVVCGEMLIDDSWSMHNEVVIALVKTGSLTIETATNAYNLQQGDIYFVAPNQKYRIVNFEGSSIDVLLLNLNNPTAVTQEYIPQNLIRALTSGNCSRFAKISPEDLCYASLYEDFKAIIEAENEKQDFFQLLVHGKLYLIFYTFFANGFVQIFEAETQGKKYRALRRITEYINENFCENISLDTIAQTTGLSRYYVSHLFKELMNTTFVNYVNELRLSRAAMLLTTTDIPIIEIAGMSGFNNISNFNRAFKMFYDTTPSKYRKIERHSM